MIKFEYTETVGWEHAIRGMRNPMNSWESSDSYWECVHGPCQECRKTPTDVTDCEYFGSSDYIIGPEDHKLMMKLRNAGTDHRKFMRMIDVYVDVTAPLYWWKEFDTYKVGTVANSCSTMHKIHAKEFTLEDFSCEHLCSDPDRDEDGPFREIKESDSEGYRWYAPLESLRYWTMPMLNKCRIAYLETKKQIKNTTDFDEKKRLEEVAKKYWWQMIQLLPSSYNQRRTLKLNYEVLANIYKSRKNHKLDEWREFCKWIEELPYSEIITGPSLVDIPMCNEIMNEAERRVKESEN